MTLFNRAQMTVSGTPGTGAITLSAATAGYRTFAAAGVTNGTLVSYLIEDAGGAWEIGIGTYMSSGTSLARTTVVESTNSNTAISATSAAVVSVIATAGTILNKRGDSLLGALNWSAAVDVASAGTTNLGAVNSNLVRITGTTAITSFGTAANCTRLVRFAAALTLTHNATTLILPGGANITTAADDTMVVQSDGSGNWRVLSYHRASGQPLYVAYENILAAALATSAEFRAKTATKIVTLDQAFAAAAIVTLTDAATIAIDQSAGLNFQVTLGGNRALGAPSGTTPGTTFTILVIQDGTGGRTLSYNAVYKFPGGTAFAIDTVANRVSLLSCYVRDSSNIIVTGAAGVR
jgi:hypothetical protein